MNLNKIYFFVVVLLAATFCQSQPLPVGISSTSHEIVLPKPEPAWTQNVIKQENRTFDFKTVARGVHTEHRFVIKNPFTEPIHIASVSSSCSCSSPYVLDGKEELKTYEKSAIVVWFRTDLYEGLKSATITVVIDKPSYAEFQLNVRGEIRSDITIEPKLVKIDNIKEGEEVSRTLSVTYTGFNPTWKIVDFKSENEHLTAQLLEMQPLPGKITAKVRLALDAQTPNGKFSDRLFLITNDKEGRREIPILIQGTVGTVISVTPETLFLGYLKSGEASSLNGVIVRGTQPFRIKNILCNNPKVEIGYTPKENEPPKILYKIPIRYLNPLEGEGAPVNGKLQAEVKIETDKPNLTPIFNVTMEIAKESEPKSEPPMKE